MSRATSTSDSPSISDPIPYEMFMITGSLRDWLHSPANSIALTIESEVVAPPDRVLSPILSDMTLAPGATPSKPFRPISPYPAAIPATWVPWPPSSKCSTTIAPSSSICSEKGTGEADWGSRRTNVKVW